MSAYYEFDRSRWPLLVAYAPPGLVPDDEVRRFVREIGGELALGEPIALVLDARHAFLSANQRTILATGARRNANHFPGLLRATAIVVRTPIERAIVGALLWLYEPPYPIRSFTDLDDALAWARATLHAPSRRASAPDASLPPTPA
ncbi:MAG: STAS/SEC14 domain-containing protein [Myxococcota bacterium]